ncbi:hypothetical protein ACJX0J_022096, partial [Zea mays]
FTANEINLALFASLIFGMTPCTSCIGDIIHSNGLYSMLLMIFLIILRPGDGNFSMTSFMDMLGMTRWMWGLVLCETTVVRFSCTKMHKAETQERNALLVNIN